MKQVIKYEASDGTLYDTEEEADERDSFLSFYDEIDSSEIYWRDTSSKEVAKWLWENYEVKRKER